MAAGSVRNQLGFSMRIFMYLDLQNGVLGPCVCVVSLVCVMFICVGEKDRAVFVGGLHKNILSNGAQVWPNM